MLLVSEACEKLNAILDVICVVVCVTLTRVNMKVLRAHDPFGQQPLPTCAGSEKKTGRKLNYGRGQSNKFVQCHGVDSAIEYVRCGIPQGSCWPRCFYFTRSPTSLDY